MVSAQGTGLGRGEQRRTYSLEREHKFPGAFSQEFHDHRRIDVDGYREREAEASSLRSSRSASRAAAATWTAAASTPFGREELFPGLLPRLEDPFGEAEKHDLKRRKRFSVRFGINQGWEDVSTSDL